MTRFRLIDPSGRLLPLCADDACGRAPRSGAAPRGAATPAADLHHDFTGDTCLRTNLVTKRMLDTARPGQVLEIISDNLSAVETIPFMLDGHDCEHVITVHHQDHWRIYARKRIPPQDLEPQDEPRP